MKKIEGWDEIKLPKPLKNYDVYWEGKGCGVYAENYKKIFIKRVKAVSPAQACNKARYSLRDEKHPHGGYATDILGDIYDEGFVEFSYKAYEAK